MASPGLEVVVVDYDCPDHAGDWVRETFPGAKVVSVPDRPWYNHSDAKQSRAAAASGDWLYFADADIRVAEGFVQTVQPLLRPGVFLLAEPRPADRRARSSSRGATYRSPRRISTRPWKAMGRRMSTCWPG